jgi:hypothetical protein
MDPYLLILKTAAAAAVVLTAAAEAVEQYMQQQYTARIGSPHTPTRLTNGPAFAHPALQQQ